MQYNANSECLDEMQFNANSEDLDEMQHNANSEDLDEMQHNAAFHLGLHHCHRPEAFYQILTCLI